MDLSGWYAYRCPPGKMVLWDGGINRTGDLSGLWSLISGESEPAPDEFLNQLPNMPLAGRMEAGVLHVESLPNLDLVIQAVGQRTNNPAYHLDSQGPAPFLAEVYNGEDLLDGDTCRFVPVTILPEDKSAARRVFDGFGPHGMVRHPMSTWVNGRTPLFASSLAPPKIRAKIVDWHYEGEMVTNVSARVGLRRTVDFRPLYDGDQWADNKVFEVGRIMDLYVLENETVVGYA